MIARNLFTIGLLISIPFTGALYRQSLANPLALQPIWINQKKINLDQNKWSYYAPGLFKGNSLLPILQNDGVLIKFPRVEKKRLTFVVRSQDLVESAEVSCSRLLKTRKAKAIKSTKTDCIVEIPEKSGATLFQWIYEDYQSLKLVSLVTVGSDERKSEIEGDFAQFKKELK